MEALSVYLSFRTITGTVPQPIRPLSSASPRLTVQAGPVVDEYKVGNAPVNKLQTVTGDKM
jgi:hypothetical protein